MSRSTRIRAWLDEHGDTVRRVCDKHGLPWQSCVAMALLESGLGRSKLARASNNLHGISYRPGWHEGYVWHWTWEILRGKLTRTRVRKRFARFDDVEDAVDGWCRFVSRRRYQMPTLGDEEDAEVAEDAFDDRFLFIVWLWARGYATSKRYPIKIATRFQWISKALDDPWGMWDVELDDPELASIRRLQGVRGRKRWALAIEELRTGFGETL